MPVPNPYSGTKYEFDPAMQAAVQGTPAGSALSPSRTGSFAEAVALLAQWMGLALPGRGGIGPVKLRSPALKAEDLKAVEASVRDWIRENVVGKTLPSQELRTESKVRGGAGKEYLPRVMEDVPGGTPESDIWLNLLGELFGQGINAKAPRQRPSGNFYSPSGNLYSFPASSGQWERGLVPGMPLLRSVAGTPRPPRLGASHPLRDIANTAEGNLRPIFWPVE